MLVKRINKLQLINALKALTDKVIYLTIPDDKQNVIILRDSTSTIELKQR